MIYFQDQTIIIRDIKVEDASSLFAWCTDKELNKYDPRPLPQNSAELLEECKSFCRKFDTEIYCSSEKARRYKYFMIVDSSGHPIGFVNFFSIDKEKQQGEMGVEIGDKRYWKKGIATKAIKVVSEYIFKNMNMKRIYIETGEENVPALGLFSKAGFIKCGEYLEDDGFRFIVMEKTP